METNNKGLLSYSSCLFAFLALLWIPTSSRSQPVTSTSIWWIICESGFLQSSLEIAIDPKIPKHERFVESSLYNLWGWEKQIDWNTAWLLFSLRVKRLPLSSFCQAAWGFRRTEPLLGDRRDRRDLPALLCVSLKGEAAHVQMWMCKADGKGIDATWRTAGHRLRQMEQASDFPSAAVILITSHYWHYLIYGQNS